MLLLLIVFSGYAIIRTAVPPWWVLASFSVVCGSQLHPVRQWMVCVCLMMRTPHCLGTHTQKAGIDSWQVIAVISMVCYYTYGMRETRAARPT